MIDIVLISEPDNNCNFSDTLMGETMGHAIIDSGCSRTVCGKAWLETYLGMLSEKSRRSVHAEKSDCRFRFGDGKIYRSTEAVILPVYFGKTHGKLRANVIECDIPLLLSRESLKRGECQIDFQSDQVIMMGEEVPIKVSQSGHYCIPLINNIGPSVNTIQQILFIK